MECRDGLLDGRHPQPDGQMRFSYARWAQQQDVLPVPDEAQRGQLSYLPLVDAGLEGEVELLQGLQEREMGQLGLHRHVPLVTRRDLRVQ